MHPVVKVVDVDAQDAVARVGVALVEQILEEALRGRRGGKDLELLHVVAVAGHATEAEVALARARRHARRGAVPEVRVERVKAPLPLVGLGDQVASEDCLLVRRLRERAEVDGDGDLVVADAAVAVVQDDVREDLVGRVARGGARDVRHVGRVDDLDAVVDVVDDDLHLRLRRDALARVDGELEDIVAVVEERAVARVVGEREVVDIALVADLARSGSQGSPGSRTRSSRSRSSARS